VPRQGYDLDRDPTEVELLTGGHRAVEGRVGAGGVFEPLPGRVVVVEPVAAVPAVSVAGDLRPRLDPRPVLRRRPDPRLRRDAPQLGVTAVVVDVGVRDDDVGDLGRRAAELGEGRRDVLGDRAVDPGVDEQQPLVADDEPLREAPAAEDGRNPVDARLDFLDAHGRPHFRTLALS
jgi:hypothetical protein